MVNFVKFKGAVNTDVLGKVYHYIVGKPRLTPAEKGDTIVLQEKGIARPVNTFFLVSIIHNRRRKLRYCSESFQLRQTNSTLLPFFDD